MTLTEVETAIRDIMKTGVSYGRTGFNLTRASINDLLNLRRQLIKEAQRASTEGISFIPDFASGAGETEADEWGD